MSSLLVAKANNVKNDINELLIQIRKAGENPSELSWEHGVSRVTIYSIRSGVEV